jgi:hypothetical protein
VVGGLTIEDVYGNIFRVNPTAFSLRSGEVVVDGQNVLIASGPFAGTPWTAASVGYPNSFMRELAFYGDATGLTYTPVNLIVNNAFAPYDYIPNTVNWGTLTPTDAGVSAASAARAFQTISGIDQPILLGITFGAGSYPADGRSRLNIYFPSGFTSIGVTTAPSPNTLFSLPQSVVSGTGITMEFVSGGSAANIPVSVIRRLPLRQRTLNTFNCQFSPNFNFNEAGDPPVNWANLSRTGVAGTSVGTQGTTQTIGGCNVPVDITVGIRGTASYSLDRPVNFTTIRNSNIANIRTFTTGAAIPAGSTFIMKGVTSGEKIAFFFGPTAGQVAAVAGFGAIATVYRSNMPQFAAAGATQTIDTITLTNA